MKIKVKTPTTIQIGTKRTTVLPHQRLDVPDTLGKKLLKLHADVVKRVR